MSLRRIVVVCSCLLLGFGMPSVAADYAAKVGKETISEKDVDQFLKNIPNAVDNEQNRRQVTEELVAHELLIQAAKQQKLDTDPRVRAAIAANTRQILMIAEQDHYLKEHPIKDSMVREQYDAWVKNYPKEEYKVRRIIVKTRNEAVQIASQAKDGKSFDELVGQSIEAESAKKGGDIGWVTPMVPKEAELLANLKTGQISDPIEFASSWEVVQVTEKRAANAPEFDKVKDRFRGLMQQEVLRRYVQELREKTTVVIP